MESASQELDLFSEIDSPSTDDPSTTFAAGGIDSTGGSLNADDDWEDDTDAQRLAEVNKHYTFGPGKTFQDQKLFGGQEHPELKIVNIPAGCEGRAIRRECELCGPLESFKFLLGNQDGAPGHAFVAFKVRGKLFTQK